MKIVSLIGLQLLNLIHFLGILKYLFKRVLIKTRLTNMGRLAEGTTQLGIYRDPISGSDPVTFRQLR